MSCQNCGSTPGVLALLQELKSELSTVKSKCSRIEKEIMGISDEAEKNPTSLMENITLKQMVEKTAHDVACLRKRMDEAEETRRLKAQSIEQSSNDRAGDEQSLSRAESIMEPFVPKGVIAETIEEEIDLLRTELEATKKGRILVKGDSFEGKTAAQITRSIATPRRPLTLALVINNYLGQVVSIVNTWQRPNLNVEFEIPPAEIASGQNEVLKFSSGSCIAAAGLIELAIGASPIRIIVLAYNDGSCMAGVPVGRGNAAQLLHNDWSWKGTEVYAQLRDIRIRSATVKAQCAIATFDIGSVQGLESCSARFGLIPKSLEISVKPRLTPNGSVSNVLTTISQSHACVLQIGNALPVDMKELLFVLDAEAGDTFPQEVKAVSSAVAFTSHSMYCEGLVSYRVATTDLRLSIGFRLKDKEHEFAIGFFPLMYRQDNSLLQFLFEDDLYFSEPDLAHGEATQGSLRITRRNIVAEAKMTNDKKAVLEVLISTF